MLGVSLFWHIHKLESPKLNLPAAAFALNRSWPDPMNPKNPIGRGAIKEPQEGGDLVLRDVEGNPATSVFREALRAAFLCNLPPSAAERHVFGVKTYGWHVPWLLNTFGPSKCDVTEMGQNVTTRQTAGYPCFHFGYLCLTHTRISPIQFHRLSFILKANPSTWHELAKMHTPDTQTCCTLAQFIVHWGPAGHHLQREVMPTERFGGCSSINSFMGRPRSCMRSWLTQVRSQKAHITTITPKGSGAAAASPAANGLEDFPGCAMRQGAELLKAPQSHATGFEASGSCNKRRTVRSLRSNNCLRILSRAASKCFTTGQLWARN